MTVIFGLVGKFTEWVAFSSGTEWVVYNGGLKRSAFAYSLCEEYFVISKINSIH